MAEPRWGIVATIKAPVDDILRFAAHHLDLGAHRLFIYLDDDNRAAFDALKRHPKCRPQLTGPEYWRKLGFRRRAKHQSRQFENARHAYGRATGQVDWLAHIDVDEFIWPDRPLAAQLAGLPDDCLCARLRPAEALAGDGPAQYFKTLTLDRAQRAAQGRALWPEYAGALNGGFLSHVAGKMIYRTGIEGLRVQIHNVFVHDAMNPGEVTLTGSHLLHCHAETWGAFRAALPYRLQHGSYRAELKPAQPGGETLHQLFSRLQDQGDAALRRFHDSVCAADPPLLAALRAEGLLLQADLALEAKRRKHFDV